PLDGQPAGRRGWPGHLFRIWDATPRGAKSSVIMEPRGARRGPALVSVIMKSWVPPSALLARPLLRARLLGQNGRMDLGLHGRVYLVTGGSRGLGFAAAQALT